MYYNNQIQLILFWKHVFFSLNLKCTEKKKKKYFFSHVFVLLYMENDKNAGKKNSLCIMYIIISRFLL